METPVDRRPASGVTLPRTPKQERSRRKQEALLDAAEELFADRGFEAVTADDIAVRAGYGTGTFYNYFANKTQAFVLVADRYERAVVPALHPVMAALESGERVMEAVAATVRAILDNKLRVPWLVRTWGRLVLTSPEVMAFHQRTNHEWERELAGVLERGIAAGRIRPVDPVVMAVTVRTVVDAVTNEAVLSSELDPDAAVDAVCTLLGAVLVDRGGS
jgi:AcrR family transcriptional regulator